MENVESELQKLISIRWAQFLVHVPSANLIKETFPQSWVEDHSFNMTTVSPSNEPIIFCSVIGTLVIKNI